MKEITIIGGGLAGLSLGVALRRQGVPVTIHEAGTYPRHRVCGEFINGLDEETSSTLGLDEIFEEAGAVRNQSTVWYSKQRRLLSQQLPEVVPGLSRFRLDQRLAREFLSLGGNLFQSSRWRATPGEKQEGIVCAQGRKLFKDSAWLGLKRHFQNLELEADLEMHLGSRGYVGLARIEDGQVNVCGLFQKEEGIASPREEVLTAYLRRNKLSDLASRLEAAEAVKNSMLGVAGIAFGNPAGREKPAERDPACIALGDQRSMICPFTGNGMASAFQSASLGLNPLVDYSNSRRHWSETVFSLNHLLSELQDQRISLSTLIQPFLLDGWRRKGFEFLAALHLVPFNFLYRKLR